VLQGLTGDTEEHWKAAVAKVCAMPLQWEPGTKTQYHGNTGMLISAEAVRRVTSGKPWEEICRERIFKPLGLESFTFIQPPADVLLIAPPKDLSQGAAHYNSTGLPASGGYGSPADLLKFLTFQTNQGLWKGKRLLEEKYWTAMHTVQYPGRKDFVPWGLGMMVRGDPHIKGGVAWFGMVNQTSPTAFSHVGTDCVMAVGDPAADLEIAFFTADSPKTKEKAQEMRNTVTDKIFGAITT
jgi:CubicO group peptidase (beta-lactamase class C family)